MCGYRARHAIIVAQACGKRAAQPSVKPYGSPTRQHPDRQHHLMHSSLRHKLFCLVLLGITGGAAASSPSHAAQAEAKLSKPVAAASEPADPGAAIEVVVNDSPITAYSLEQRIKLLSLDGSAGWQERMQAKLKSPDTQTRFKAFVQARNPKSQAEFDAAKNSFIESLRQQAIAEVRPGLRDRAMAQLINETLELQEAKRQSVLASNDELNGAVTDIAKRNKKTLKEFEASIATTGISVHAFRERIRAQMSWQRVLASHFRGQIVVGKTELEQAVAADAGLALPGAGTVELKLQRIVIPLKAGDVAASIAGYAAADELRQRAKACSNLAQLAKSSAGARFEDLGSVKPEALDADVRPMLANAEAGSVPPPILTKNGIEIYAVCERSSNSQNETAQAAARDKIERAKLDARSRGLLSDLCASASIEPRNGFKLAKTCGAD